MDLNLYRFIYVEIKLCEAHRADICLSIWIKECAPVHPINIKAGHHPNL